MKTKTIKDFLNYGLNKLTASDSEYANGERYMANDNTYCSMTCFRTLKEAREFARENKNEWRELCEQ
jgi:hypothetical protein